MESKCFGPAEVFGNQREFIGINAGKRPLSSSFESLLEQGIWGNRFRTQLAR